MQRIDAVIIGAGQAGLAMSQCLTRLGVDHVVLERGRVGERWRSATWDSLRLLTPNWMTRLPGWAYAGPDFHGFMRKAELVSFLGAYAEAYGRADIAATPLSARCARAERAITSRPIAAIGWLRWS